jgi:hypothetical protein
MTTKSDEILNQLERGVREVQGDVRKEDEVRKDSGKRFLVQTVEDRQYTT